MIQQQGAPAQGSVEPRQRLKSKVRSQGSTTAKVEGMDKVLSLVRQRVRACHQATLDAGAKIDGSYRFEMRVTEGGGVDDVRLEAVRSAGAEVDRCMKTALSETKFERPERVGVVNGTFELGMAEETER